MLCKIWYYSPSQSCKSCFIFLKSVMELFSLICLPDKNCTSLRKITTIIHVHSTSSAGWVKIMWHIWNRVSNEENVGRDFILFIIHFWDDEEWVLHTRMKTWMWAKTMTNQLVKRQHFRGRISSLILIKHYELKIKKHTFSVE